MAYGAQGLGAVKRALPSADYAQIKLVAAMMNTQQHWCAPGEAGGGAGMQGAAAAVRENVPANGGAGSGAPAAKRVRTSSDGRGTATGAAAAAELAAGLTAEELADFDDWN